jgi:DNA (cytosine-5)-methyltransferase 1
MKNDSWLYYGFKSQKELDDYVDSICKPRDTSPVTHPGIDTRAVSRPLLISIFSGIDLLGLGFEKEGFSVVKAGDIAFGQDIRNQHFPPNRFDGLIGGSPCQDFSRARRTPPTGYGLEMLNEFIRIVKETRVPWFLLENVPQVPEFEIEGYHILRYKLNANECGSEQNRPRVFVFGSTEGYILDIKRDKPALNKSRCVTASEGNKTNRRSFSKFCELQGLPPDFDLPLFKEHAKYTAVGNGVNILAARRIAAAIRDATEGTQARTVTNTRLCICGCSRILHGSGNYATVSCRKRFERKNKKRDQPGVNNQSCVTFTIFTEGGINYI